MDTITFAGRCDVYTRSVRLETKPNRKSILDPSVEIVWCYRRSGSKFSAILQCSLWLGLHMTQSTLLVKTFRISPSVVTIVVNLTMTQHTYRLFMVIGSLCIANLACALDATALGVSLPVGLEEQLLRRLKLKKLLLGDCFRP